MNQSYFRIKIPCEEAIKWLCIYMEGKSYKEIIETTSDKIVQVSINEQGNWKGSVLYVYENMGWTVIEDISIQISLYFQKPEQCIFLN